MDEVADPSTPSGGVVRRFITRLLAIGENRFQLLLVEVQEERNRLVDMVCLTIATAALGLLAGILWSAALIILLWPSHPACALLILGGVYVAAAVVTWRRAVVLRDKMQTLAATLEQLRKDHECLAKQ
jgi:uncharacterized membrane protein YqjE